MLALGPFDGHRDAQIDRTRTGVSVEIECGIGWDANRNFTRASSNFPSTGRLSVGGNTAAAGAGAQAAFDVFETKIAGTSFGLHLAAARLHQRHLAAAGADPAGAANVMCADVAANRTRFYVVANIFQLDVAGTGRD